MTNTGADLAYRALRALDVEHVFGIVSVHNIPIYDAILRARRHHADRHASRAGGGARGGWLCAQRRQARRRDHQHRTRCVQRGAGPVRSRLCVVAGVDGHRPDRHAVSRQRQGLPARSGAPARNAAHRDAPRRAGARAPTRSPRCWFGSRRDAQTGAAATRRGRNSDRFPVSDARRRDGCGAARGARRRRARRRSPTRRG